jgi:hypothetical protein
MLAWRFSPVGASQSKWYGAGPGKYSIAGACAAAGERGAVVLHPVTSVITRRSGIRAVMERA